MARISRPIATTVLDGTAPTPGTSTVGAPGMLSQSALKRLGAALAAAELAAALDWPEAASPWSPVATGGKADDVAAVEDAAGLAAEAAGAGFTGGGAA